MLLKKYLAYSSMVERRPYKAKVYGSSPYGPILVKKIHPFFFSTKLLTEVAKLLTGT